MTNAAPKLLLSTAPFFRFPLREAFERIREAGFEAVEVMVTSDPATQDGRSLRELAAEFGLTIDALHAPFLLLTRRVWGTDPVTKIYRATQVAEQAGIPLVVVHPPYKWQVKYQRWIDHNLAEYSARAGVSVAVENMFPVKIRGDRGLRFHASQDFEDLDRYPTLVLDTSHLAVAGYDILEAYQRYRTKVVHFHLSDNAGKGWDSHLPMGDERGTLPLDELLDAVMADGFGGTISLELDLRRYIDEPAATRDLLVQNREVCQRLLAART
jgi:sugar phosphate isomerase/epimerase